MIRTELGRSPLKLKLKIKKAEQVRINVFACRVLQVLFRIDFARLTKVPEFEKS